MLNSMYFFRLNCLLFGLLLSSSAFAQEGIDFFHGSWDEGLVKAGKEQKLIFVDAYAKWCGPCKRMAASVFTDAKVGEFFNQHFVNMKLDMEEEEGAGFREAFPVSAFPTLFFIDPVAKQVVQKQVGALDVEGFLKLARNVLGKVDNSAEFAKRYEAGDRDPALILQYITALNRSGKPTLKIANDYLLSQQDLTTPDNLKIIFEGATESDSRIFDLLIQHKSAIIALMGEELWSKKVESACQKTAGKALEFRDATLHQEAKNKMKQHCPASATEFNLNADIKFATTMGDAPGFVKAAEAYLKWKGKNDASKLHAFSEQVLRYFKDQKAALLAAEKWSEKAATNGGLYTYYLGYAQVLKQLGKNSEAIIAAQQAKKIAAESKPEAIPMIDRIMEDWDQ